MTKEHIENPKPNQPLSVFYILPKVKSKAGPILDSEFGKNVNPKEQRDQANKRLEVIRKYIINLLNNLKNLRTQ